MTFTKKSKFFLGILVLSLFSLAYIFSTLKKTPTPSPSTTTIVPPIQSPLSLVQNTPLTRVTLDPNTPFPSLPLTLPVYTGSVTAPDIQTITRALASYYQITPATNSSIFWYNSTKDRFLTVSSYSVSYAVDSNLVPGVISGKNPPTLNEALSSATQFVNSFDFWKDYTPITSEIQFYNDSSGEYVAAPQNSAGLIQIPFSPSLNRFPLLYSNSDVTPLIVLVGQKNQIVKIEAHPQPITVSTSPLKNYYTLSKDQLLSQIQNNQVHVLRGLEDYIVTDNLKNYPPITINHISVEYRLDPQSQLVSPYFRLVGTASDYPGAYSTIILTTPAVNTTP